MGALNACCWFKYGLMIQDTTVILVNFVGATLMSCYTICFYYFCTRRLPLQKQIVSAFSFFVTLNLYLTYGESDAASGRYMCGLVASGFAIGFFASPLATLVHVVRTRSTSTLLLDSDILAQLTSSSQIKFLLPQNTSFVPNMSHFGSRRLGNMSQ